ncbi:hypothetical protein PR048_028978 [Dryococelus australis]|uniref:DDE-1 domain-containing protein n=1 Tax=Dryococelus australis TaxID=614101 RepID=A0ABQ9GEQ0_9NEOP|nr:hypothetical protein PR048_028978 [Dryococelus australis]
MSGKRASSSLVKYKIFKEVDEQKIPKAEIVRQHGIPKSALFTILNMREEIVNAVQKKGHNNGSAMRSQNLAVNGPMVQKIADEFALRLGIDDLKCLSGWLDCFKVHHGISCHKIVGKSASVDPKSMSEWLPLLQNVLSRCQPCDVYNADELGMFCNLMLDRTLAVKGGMCKGMKRSKEHLTVLCCNMDGSIKMKPLVIGKLKKPSGFRGNIILCDYDFNKKLVVLPKNTSSMLEPLDQGIIQQVKLKFRKMLVRNMDDGSDCPQLEGSAAKTISNCFSHAHFVTPVDEEAAVHVLLAAASSKDLNYPPPVDTEPQPGLSTVPLSVRQTVTQPCDETWQQLAPDCTFEEFVTAEDIAVWGTLDYVNDVHGQQELSGEDDVEGEAEESAQVPVTRDLLKAGDVYAAVLRRHGAHLTHFRKFVEQTLVKKKQTTIKDFFKK